VEVESDIVYRDTSKYDPSLGALDIYYQPSSKQKKRPVAVFVHGGNWSGGDKKCFYGPEEQTIAGWFVRNGYVFVAINFRLPGSPLSPSATVVDMVDDIAKAIKWLTVNIRRYGGQKSKFVLIGYSSGSHLAALMVSDKKYLKRYRLNPSDVWALIGIDVPFFNVPLALEIMQIEDLGLPNQDRRLTIMQELLGDTTAEQEQVSPVAHIGPWLLQTHFLLLSATYHQGHPQDFTRRMNTEYQERLVAQGIDAEHHHFDDLNHTDFINSFTGELAACVDKFLKRIEVKT